MQFLSDIYLPAPSAAAVVGRTGSLPFVRSLTTGYGVRLTKCSILRLKKPLLPSPIIRPLLSLCRCCHSLDWDISKLGQPLSTLSGGERQRLKLAARIAEGIPQNIAVQMQHGTDRFCFDEPTTGLHFADTAKLVDIFDRLTHLGATVIVIEHNLDVIGAADG